MASVAAVASIGVAAPVQAKTHCYGDECIGLNPAETTCASDAVTIGAMAVHGGMLDLRWSESCNSAWGRWSFTDLHDIGANTSSTGVSHARVTAWNPGKESQGTGYDGKDNMSGDWIARSWWSNMISAETTACTGVEVVRQGGPPPTGNGGMGGSTQNDSLGWTWGPCHD